MPATARTPGERPFADRPEGVDCFLAVEHIVILMKENHSYDNYFGMLRRGDGFTLDSSGVPTNFNPDQHGAPVRAHHLDLPINPPLGLSQTWNSSHQQWNSGAMDRFVTTTGRDAPMGYLDAADLPWYYGLAAAYGIGDRYFAACLAQTFPNRRFLQGATAQGLVSTALPSPFVHPPANGLIWDMLDRNGISWANYFGEVPEVGLWPRNILRYHDHLHSLERFHDDAAAGQLPAVSLITPGLLHSEGEIEDDQLGESETAHLFEALTSGPQWRHSMFVLVWDEGGGFYDHVPPPGAPPPDDIAPAINVPPDEPGAYDRLGFRVPCLVASPFSKQGYVSSVVYDHTSVLATIEYKWNLPALTHRDGWAAPLFDFLDFDSPPAFLVPAALPRPTIWPFTGRR